MIRKETVFCKIQLDKHLIKSGTLILILKHHRFKTVQRTPPFRCENDLFYKTISKAENVSGIKYIIKLLKYSCLLK